MIVKDLIVRRNEDPFAGRFYTGDEVSTISMVGADIEMDVRQVADANSPATLSASTAGVAPGTRIEVDEFGFDLIIAGADLLLLPSHGIPGHDLELVYDIRIRMPGGGWEPRVGGKFILKEGVTYV